MSRAAGGLVLLALALSGCSGSSPAPATTRPAPAAVGDLSEGQLRALLLQPADLPGLTQRREFAGVELGTQAPPQLALCSAPVPDAPHQIANVVASSGAAGAVKVFQVVSAYADEAAARAAHARAEGQARRCSSYEVDGTAYRVEDVTAVRVLAGAQALHYRLTTPSVIEGDVRTLVRSGRFTVLISGFGAPPGGQPLLDYQADLARRAIARLG